MANNDTLRGVGVTGVRPVTTNGEVLEPVSNIEWSPEEKAAIRAISLAMTSTRKPVSNDEIVKDLRKALATKAKTTFYTPFETEFKNAERVASRMQRPITTTLTEYMHKHVSATGWSVMNNLGCKLDVLPPKVNPASPESPVDTPKA